MNKLDFIENLRTKLSDLPRHEVDDRISFYSEMIDDRVEEGLTEEEAVFEIGSVEEIADRIIAETASVLPQTAPENRKEEKKSENKKSAKIIFWASSPIWLPLAVIGFATALILLASLWVVVGVLWSAFGAFICGALGGVVFSVIDIVTGDPISIFMIAIALFSAGMAIFSFYGCIAATKGSVLLTKSSILYLKKFIEKGKGYNE